MRKIHILAGLALALAGLVLSGCITTPEIADRIVELVTTTSVSDTLHASGSTNSIIDSGGVDVNDIDVPSILSNAGIDVSNVTGISLASIEYAVIQADPTAGRHLDGSIQVAVAGGAATDLVNPFGAAADAVTGFHAVSLHAGAVAQINNLLAQLLANVKNNAGPVANGHIDYTVSGTSTPTNTNTDFVYVLRLTLNVQGTVKTKVLTGK
jgi:hypothetical protein